LNSFPITGICESGLTHANCIAGVKVKTPIVFTLSGIGQGIWTWQCI